MEIYTRPAKRARRLPWAQQTEVDYIGIVELFNDGTNGNINTLTDVAGPPGLLGVTTAPTPLTKEVNTRGNTLEQILRARRVAKAMKKRSGVENVRSKEGSCVIP